MWEEDAEKDDTNNVAHYFFGRVQILLMPLSTRLTRVF